MKAIILAGGSGERFWPLSTKEKPKQFLRLLDERSLIRTTYDRLALRMDPEDIIVVTSREHRKVTLDELPEIDPENIIGEPKRMNTAPACVLGSLMAEDDEKLLTLPADHIIPDTDKFWSIVDRGVNGIDKLGGLFTFGIKPVRPETGYGYIEFKGELLDHVHEVTSFREKPDLETARNFLASDNFLWNSGIFLWTKSCLISEMRKWCPKVMDPLEGINPREPEEVERAYDRVERISIDYAIMERSDNVRVIPTDIEWSDVGSWDSLADIRGFSHESDSVSLSDSRRVMILSKTGRKIAVVGLTDIIVVDTPDGLLVLDRKSSQKVREVSGHFKG